MPEAQPLEVRERTVLGKKVRALRRRGILPAVIVGARQDSLAVETDTRSFEHGFKRWGLTTLLSLRGLPGGDVPALVHGVARDPRSGRVLHVDFARVSLTERTHADVPLHFVGEAGAVKNAGGVLVHALDHVRVEAYPQDIPRAIEVDLSPIAQIDDSLYVRDLIVEANTVRILNEPDELVARAVRTRAEEAAAPAPTAAPEAAAEGAPPPTEGQAAEAAPAQRTEKKT
jgi:large subunit ribosomal protein L25